MIDKNIHKNEFRLRVLCTNTCNKRCSFCLNDFQPKNQEEQFLSEDIAIKAIDSYLGVPNKKPVVTFSGGEPGLWSSLLKCAEFSKRNGACVKVCTNGLALNNELDAHVNNWHIHVTEIFELPSWVSKQKVVIQFVVCNGTTIEEMLRVAEYYKDCQIKFFVNFYEPDKTSLYGKIEAVQKLLGCSVATRFTGVQVNRGSLCLGCVKDCITLKGAWVFPDGSISTCPQGVLPKHFPKTFNEYAKLMTCAAWGHNT